MLPSFRDKDYLQAEKVYATDRFLAWTLLPLIPRAVTPNHLTALRLVLTPAVVWLLWAESYSVGVPLFFFAALTDALDGALARTQHMITAWGRMFDPFADKLLIGIVALVLAYTVLPPWLAVAIIGSEVALIIAALTWYSGGRLVQANIWGKIKMILQVVGVGAILFSLWLGWPLIALATYALVASLFFAVASFIRYGS